MLEKAEANSEVAPLIEERVGVNGLERGVDVVRIAGTNPRLIPWPRTAPRPGALFIVGR